MLACGRDADTVCYVVSLALSVCLLVWVSIEADYPLGNDAVKFWVFVLLDSVLTLFVLLPLCLLLRRLPLPVLPLLLLPPLLLPEAGTTSPTSLVPPLALAEALAATAMVASTQALVGASKRDAAAVMDAEASHPSPPQLMPVATPAVSAAAGLVTVCAPLSCVASICMSAPWVASSACRCATSMAAQACVDSHRRAHRGT